MNAIVWINQSNGELLEIVHENVTSWDIENGTFVIKDQDKNYIYSLHYCVRVDMTK